MSTRTRTLTTAALALTLALGATACSDDGDGGGGSGGGGGGGDLSAAEQAYVDAMVAAAESSGDDDLLALGGDPECLASRWVQIVGVERLEAAGIEPEDFGEDDADMDELGLDRGEAEEMVGSFDDCGVDVREAMIDSMVSEAEAEGGSGDDLRDCLEAGLTDDGLRAIMVASLLEGEEALDEGDFDDPEAAAAFAALFGCMFAGLEDLDG